MAVAVRVLYQVILMVIFTCVETVQRKDLHGQRRIVLRLDFLKNLIYHRLVRFMHPVNSRTVSGAAIIALAILEKRIDRLEEQTA
jgi:hypothetical protein